MSETKRKLNSSAKLANEIWEYAHKNGMTIGDKLPTENDMAEIFGVSRTSIREAISYLAASNYVETRHGRGTFLIHDSNNVGPTNLDDLLDACSFADLMELRILLETWGAGLAAKRATKEQIDEIEDSIKKIELCDNEDDYFASDLCFHESVAKASDNQFIITVCKHLFKELERQSYKVKILTWLTRDSTISHMWKTLEAIKANDSTSACKYMGKHLKEIDKLSAKHNIHL